MMWETVEHGRDGRIVAEHLAPVVDRTVRCQDRARALVGGLVTGSEGHPTHLKSSAAWVPYPVLG
jgi:hypothetical protein